MGRKRSLSEEDERAWRSFIAQIEPLNSSGAAESAPAFLADKKAPSQKTLSEEWCSRKSDQEKDYDALSETWISSVFRNRKKNAALKNAVRIEKNMTASFFLPDFSDLSKMGGLDKNTARRLKRGERKPDATLDLHGFTAADAHSALQSFIAKSHQAGLRCVLVITGKGKGSAQHKEGPYLYDHAKAGLLRTYTPRWLAEPGMRSYIVGVYPAHRHHGGDGALYVYLKNHRI